MNNGNGNVIFLPDAQTERETMVFDDNQPGLPEDPTSFSGDRPVGRNQIVVNNGLGGFGAIPATDNFFSLTGIMNFLRLNWKVLLGGFAIGAIGMYYENKYHYFGRLLQR